LLVHRLIPFVEGAAGSPKRRTKFFVALAGGLDNVPRAMDMENGLFNLACIIISEVFCLCLIPIILMKGTPKGSAANDE
jgi:hypothetical protein